MGRKRTPNKETPVAITIKRPVVRLLIGLLMWLITLLIIFGAFSAAGVIGNSLYRGGIWLVGSLGLIPVIGIMVSLGWHLIKHRREKVSAIIPGIYIGMISIGLIATAGILPINESYGGLAGRGLANVSTSLFGEYVALIVTILIGSVGGLLLIERYTKFLDRFGEESEDDDQMIRIRNGDEVEEVSLDDEEEEAEEPKKKTELTITGVNKKKPDPEQMLEIIEPSDRRLLDDYNPPPLSLLSKTSGKPNVGDIKERAASIQKTLDQFGIEVEMDEVAVGPTITRYAIKPATGVRVSKILSLQNNLELDLAASIRIEAPIPGKSLVGIEIPNTTKVTVGMRDILSDSQFIQSDKPLLFSLGKTVTGETKFANLAKLPHLLIAGATGAGKSGTVHNIIVSLLYRNGPDMMRFIMVDPKRVELTLYNNIPHLLTPVIKDAKKAILALKWAVKEMERRYDVLEGHGVRDIMSYHSNIVEPAYASAKEGDPEDVDEMSLPERMPYIVVIIDEMADLMQAYPRELESAIVRLAQMSRAVGIHLILSTQRPSVNVITGLIKANVPGRIAMRVSSQIDSRTILDTAGAEKLLGAGDMLFSGGDMDRLTRLQCPFVPEKEVKTIVKHIIKHNQDYLVDEIDLPDSMDSDRSSLAGGSLTNDDEDDLYEEARDIIINAGKGSTSYLQRKLRIGYSRAARLMDMLEEQGVVGPPDGSKPREVLLTTSRDGQADSDYEEDEEELD